MVVMSDYTTYTTEDMEKLMEQLRTCQQENVILKENVASRDTELLKLQKLMRPVCEEYDEVKNKYEIETICRHEAETFASKMSKENKVLRRQSHLFLMKMGGEVAIEEETETEKVYRKRKDNIMMELEVEVSHLRAHMIQQTDDLNTEREKTELTTSKLLSTEKELLCVKKSLQDHSKLVSKHEQMTEDVYKNVEELTQSLQIEVECRSQAELYASKMHSQNDVMKRQSNVLMCNISSNEKLSKAMLDIEELTSQRNSLNAAHTQEVNELQAQLEALGSTQKMGESQAALAKLEAENATLLGDVNECRSLHEQLRRDYKNLKLKYDHATPSATAPPMAPPVAPPPPPPPPPVPPPLPPILWSFTKQSSSIEKIKARNEALFPKEKPKSNDGDLGAAITEMMARIKSGRPMLKPSPRRVELIVLSDRASIENMPMAIAKWNDGLRLQPSCPDPCPKPFDVMGELQNVLRRRNRSNSDVGLGCEVVQMTRQGNDVERNMAASKMGCGSEPTDPVVLRKPKPHNVVLSEVTEDLERSSHVTQEAGYNTECASVEDAVYHDCTTKYTNGDETLYDDCMTAPTYDELTDDPIYVDLADVDKENSTNL